ncbi:Sec-independent protein translocase protein TatB [Rhodocyclus tenuis]|uniref:Sec-independent protein translocase protein TatB n=1 Tax=Rhodocyclus tenuis TaxID=1066 RepID=A0A840FXP3_RHOTE|nr:Sec-independent protein translocase protein TatB [Rhodocyclus tenuis]MBB4246887.1 sec-independent protein translocase protein TatB [Rhodocyclus tenuis]
MFDVAFSELLIIAVVALIVIGPQRLPKVARTAGVLLGRLQRYVTSVKADINREIQLDELRKLQAELAESARKLESQVGAGVSGVQRSLDDTAQSLNATAASLSSGVTAAVSAPAAEAVSATPAAAASAASASDIPAASWTAESFAAAFGGAETDPAKAPLAPPVPAAQVANESKV